MTSEDQPPVQGTGNLSGHDTSHNEVDCQLCVSGGFEEEPHREQRTSKSFEDRRADNIRENNRLLREAGCTSFLADFTKSAKHSSARSSRCTRNSPRSEHETDGPGADLSFPSPRRSSTRLQMRKDNTSIVDLNDKTEDSGNRRPSSAKPPVLEAATDANKSLARASEGYLKAIMPIPEDPEDVVSVDPQLGTVNIEHDTHDTDEDMEQPATQENQEAGQRSRSSSGQLLRFTELRGTTPELAHLDQELKEVEVALNASPISPVLPYLIVDPRFELIDFKKTRGGAKDKDDNKKIHDGKSDPLGSDHDHFHSDSNMHEAPSSRKMPFIAGTDESKGRKPENHAAQRDKDFPQQQETPQHANVATSEASLSSPDLASTNELSKRPHRQGKVAKADSFKPLRKDVACVEVDNVRQRGMTPSRERIERENKAYAARQENRPISSIPHNTSEGRIATSLKIASLSQYAVDDPKNNVQQHAEKAEKAAKASKEWEISPNSFYGRNRDGMANSYRISQGLDQEHGVQVDISVYPAPLQRQLMRTILQPSSDYRARRLESMNAATKTPQRPRAKFRYVSPASVLDSPPDKPGNRAAISEVQMPASRQSSESLWAEFEEASMANPEATSQTLTQFENRVTRRGTVDATVDDVFSAHSSALPAECEQENTAHSPQPRIKLAQDKSGRNKANLSGADAGEHVPTNGCPSAKTSNSAGEFPNVNREGFFMVPVNLNKGTRKSRPLFQAVKIEELADTTWTGLHQGDTPGEVPKSITTSNRGLGERDNLEQWQPQKRRKKVSRSNRQKSKSVDVNEFLHDSSVAASPTSHSNLDQGANEVCDLAKDAKPVPSRKNKKRKADKTGEECPTSARESVIGKHAWNEETGQHPSSTRKSKRRKFRDEDNGVEPSTPGGKLEEEPPARGACIALATSSASKRRNKKEIRRRRRREKKNPGGFNSRSLPPTVDNCALQNGNLSTETQDEPPIRLEKTSTCADNEAHSMAPACSQMSGQYPSYSVTPIRSQASTTHSETRSESPSTPIDTCDVSNGEESGRRSEPVLPHRREETQPAPVTPWDPSKMETFKNKRASCPTETPLDSPTSARSMNKRRRRGAHSTFWSPVGTRRYQGSGGCRNSMSARAVSGVGSPSKESSRPPTANNGMFDGSKPINKLTASASSPAVSAASSSLFVYSPTDYPRLPSLSAFRSPKPWTPLRQGSFNPNRRREGLVSEFGKWPFGKFLSRAGGVGESSRPAREMSVSTEFALQHPDPRVRRFGHRHMLEKTEPTEAELALRAEVRYLKQDVTKLKSLVGVVDN